MAEGTLVLSENPEESLPVGTSAELREALSQVASRYSRPVLVLVQRTDRSSALVGVGAAESVVLIHVPRTDGSTDEWTAVGDLHRPGVAEFYYLDQHHSEFPAKYLVPWSVALELVERFVETGEADDGVVWDHNTF